MGNKQSINYEQNHNPIVISQPNTVLASKVQRDRNTCKMENISCLPEITSEHKQNDLFLKQIYTRNKYSHSLTQPKSNLITQKKNAELLARPKQKGLKEDRNKILFRFDTQNNQIQCINNLASPNSKSKLQNQNHCQQIFKA